MASLSAKGSSTSWTGQQINVIRIFNIMVDNADDLDTEWADLPEEVLCSQAIYARFAYFLLHTFKVEGGVNKGKPLDGGTPANYLAIAINAAAAKFKAVGSDATKRFFNCLDTNSTLEELRWLRGLKANMKREIMERMRDAGDPVGRSEGAHSLPPRPNAVR